MPFLPRTPPTDPVLQREVLAIRRQLLALRTATRLLRHDWLRQKYNPDQPRVPAGDPTGGRWTSGHGGGGGDGFGFGFGGGSSLAEFLGGGDGGTVFDESGNEAWSSFNEGYSDDGSVFERDIVNRDGSTIQSEYAASRAAGFDERQTVTLTSGEKVTFETTDRTQTILYGGKDGEVVSRTVWTPSGPEADATVQPVLAPLAVPGATILLGGAIAFGWQSLFNGTGGQQAVMALKANEFAPGAVFPEMSWVGRITDDEVRAACPRMPEVEALLAGAIARSGGLGNYLNESTYGTALHKDVAREVNSQQDPNFVAERSTLKEAIEGESLIGYYGQKGTIRTDIVENVDGKTVCGYDLKTGKANLTWDRSKELVTNMKILFPNATRFLIMQVKPVK